MKRANLEQLRLWWQRRVPGLDKSPDGSNGPSRLPAPSLARRLLHLLSVLVLDIIAPIAGYSALVGSILKSLYEYRSRVVLAPAAALMTPSDYNGTVWFYWWHHLALTTGRSLYKPDVICAPSGQFLGTNFPNRIDAILAFPFFHLWSFPTSFNLFVIALLVLASYAGYLGFRALTSYRLLAWTAGALFGLNPYSLAEIRLGRPASAMVFTLPLVIGAWICCLKAPTRRSAIGWAVVTGLFGALTFHAYLPFAMWLAMLALLIAAGYIATGAAGSRRRPVGMALLAAVVGGLFALPYVHEVMVVRKMDSSGAAKTLADRNSMLAPWSPTLWSDLLTLARADAGPARLEKHPWIDWHNFQVQEVQRRSLSIDAFWQQQSRDIATQTWLPPVLIIFLLLLAPLGGARGLGWLAVTLFFYVLSLGPYLSIVRNTDAIPLQIDGRIWSLPSLWMINLKPQIMGFLRPIRVFPLFHLCLLATIVTSTDHLSGRLHRFFVRWSRPLATGIALVFATLIAGVQFRALENIQDRGGLTIPLYWWRPNPFFAQLAKHQDGSGIVELPEGLGHGTALFQAYHQHPRSSGHHDDIPALQHGEPPPADCASMPFLQALWYLGRDQDQVAATGGLSARAIQEAIDAGYRYVVLYRNSVFFLMRTQNIPFRLSAIEETLTGLLGEPIYSDAELVAYALKVPTGTAPTP